MSNSSLVVYTKISPHQSGRRNHKIDTVSIHCMAGNASIESCGQTFQDREASSNYGIGTDGRIGMYVEEKDRSWCTSSGSNDNRAVTIEVANDGGADTGWHVSDKAMKSLICLLTDICQRNGIKRLLWQANKDLIGHVDQQNMSVHRWFANKACPGDYLYNKHGWIAEEINKRLEESEDDDMDGKTISQKLNEFLAEQPTSDYAKESSEKAIKSGLFADGDKDGLVDNPRGILTREQLAVILNRAGLLDK